MKKWISGAVLTVGIITLAFHSCAQVKTLKTDTIMEPKLGAGSEEHFPRIEVYVTNGDSTPNAPRFIDRTTYILSNKDVFNQSKLHFLPEFQEEKEDITLGHYFEMHRLNNLPQRTSLFPRSLDSFKQIKDKAHLKTIIDYETRPPQKVEIVWLDKENWYVNNVFYHLDVKPLVNNATKTISQPKLMEGEMTEFLTYSFAIQKNIDERIRHLGIQSPTTPGFVKDKVVLTVAKSPGGPASNSYSYTVYADGRIATPGNTYFTADYQLSHDLLVAINRELRGIDFKKWSELHPSAAAPHIHDGQSMLLGGFQNGTFYRLVYPIGGGTVPSEVAHFHSYFLGIMAELDVNK